MITLTYEKLFRETQIRKFTLTLEIKNINIIKLTLILGIFNINSFITKNSLTKYHKKTNL